MIKYANIDGSNERLQINNIFCIGRNYREHIKEMGVNEENEIPVVFMKPTSSLSNDSKIEIPVYNNKKIGTDLHYEVEIVVSISKDGVNIKEENADDHILGYAIGLDLTLRDIQQEAKRKGLPWLTSKGFLGSALMSDIILKENIKNPNNIDFELRLNTEKKQIGNTSEMIFSFRKLISYISYIFGLSKGDLIFTGTPSGIGSIQKGDKINARLGNLVELKAEFNG